MDFASMASSLGLGGEFTTPVGKAIEAATSESLVNPDWGLNMQICDEINRRTDGPSHATKALRRRLRSDNPKVIQLTLTLCETTIKNCSRSLHRALGTKEFLTEVIGLCHGQKGFEVRSQALRLVQEWGIAFQDDRSLAFAETYGRLQAQGMRFPAVEGGAPVFTPPIVSGGGVREHLSKDSVQAPTQTMEKLEADLQMVKDKVNLCREMLPESAGVEKDEALAEVVGFLEACRPRMVDLVEAGMGGALGEDTFATSLQINDALLRTLDAEREGTPIAVEDHGDRDPKDAAPLLDLDGGKDAPLTGKMASFSIDDDEDDSELSRASATVPPGKSGKLTKLGAVPLKGSDSSSAKVSKAEASGDDDLDDFLNSLGDDTGAAGSAEGSADLADEDLDKMLA